MSGRIGPCEKCQYPNCEYIIGTFQNCPRCAGKIKHTYTLANEDWGLSEWFIDEKTPVIY